MALALGFLFAFVLWQGRQIRYLRDRLCMTAAVLDQHIRFLGAHSSETRAAIQDHESRLAIIEAEPETICVDLTDDPIFDEDGFEIEPTLN